MPDDESDPKSQPIARQKLTVTFRENGDPEGRTLQEYCEQAPVGSKIKAGGKIMRVKTREGWESVKCDMK
jgi:hypothetical protein